MEFVEYAKLKDVTGNENVSVISTHLITPRNYNDNQTIYCFVAENVFPVLYGILNSDIVFDKFKFALKDDCFKPKSKILEFVSALASVGFPIKDTYEGEDTIFNQGYVNVTTGEFAFIDEEILIWDLGQENIILINFESGTVKSSLKHLDGVHGEIFKVINFYD